MNNAVLYTLLGMSVITYLTRFPMLFLSARMKMPARLSRALKMASVGVFSALTVPPMLFHHAADGRWSPEYLLAGLVALAVGLWKKAILLSLLAGVISLVLIRHLPPGWFGF